VSDPSEEPQNVCGFVAFFSDGIASARFVESAAILLYLKLTIYRITGKFGGEKVRRIHSFDHLAKKSLANE